MIMNRLVIAFAAMCVSSALAFAQSPEKIAEEHFNKGTTDYNLGRFVEAATHFTKAYEAWPQNEFLYNIAQSYRLGGNCKQALYMYKRFKSLKEKDTKAPMSAKKKSEVDKFIKELTECAAKADSSAGAQPDTLDRPPSTSTTTPPPVTPVSPPTTSTVTTPTSTVPPPTTTTTPPTTTPPPTTASAALESPDEGEEQEDDGVTATVRADKATTISARLTGGVALIGNGDLDIPIQPAFNAVGGYPLPAGPATIEVGAGFSYTPLPYEAMGVQQRGTMFGARVVGAVMYPIAPKLFLRGELGAGIVYLGGLVAGNPITAARDEQSFTLPSFRFGVGADYEVAPKIVATVSPFAISFSPGAEGMYGGSLREINVLVGVGYRQ
jgi:hypothetical protein